jgi:hypothetical protein
MTTTVEQLFRKQRQASPSDLRDWGWLQTQFPESCGSGGVPGPEIGSDGHLWEYEPSAETAARGAGMRKSVVQIIPQRDPDGWKLHAKSLQIRSRVLEVAGLGWVDPAFKIETDDHLGLLRDDKRASVCG